MEAYLICTQGNHDKFWGYIVNATTLYTLWGRRNTEKCRYKKEVFNSRSSALAAGEKKAKEKLRRGYEYPEFAQATTARSILIDKLRKNGVDIDVPEEEGKPSQDTGITTIITWTAKKRVTLENLNDAVTLVNTVLNTAGLEPRVFITPEGQVTFPGVGDKDLHFGYPPKDFIDSLAPVAQKTLVERNVSRDGWLSVEGTGSGALEYGESMHQFIMPLFLAVLIRNAKNFSAINHDNESLGVCLDWENMKLPKGYPVEKLVNAVREHWFTTDSRARIAEDADSGYVYW